jgi:co-chaperonin GroES (HSP10)
MKQRSEVDPINDQIVFEFLEDTTQGKFNEKTSGGVLIVEQADKQVQGSRWVRVLAKGPNVSEGIAPGNIVLIQNLKWTSKFRLTDKDYWVTNEESILATWDDMVNLPGEVA